MASIIMKRGVTSEISNTPISDGQILFETDTKNIYMDNGSNRIKYVNNIQPQADSGYVIIGDTLIQWGRKTYDTRANDNYVYTNISLPIPFADVNYSINLIPTYSIDVTSYYDATTTYSNATQNSFQAKAISKSGGFTTTNFPANNIAISWIAIGKYDDTTVISE